jgi:hypothetical protein
MIFPQRVRGYENGATEHIEIIDWHFLDREGKAWLPSAWEGTSEALAELRRALPESAEHMLLVILDESGFGDPEIHGIVRELAYQAMRELDEASRTAISECLIETAEGDESGRAMRAVAAMRSLGFTFPDREAAPKKEASRVVDPEKKAESLLAQARGLESANLKAAIEYYHRILKEFPDTGAAKAASKRLEQLAQ